jgi:hypothetical protein
VKVAAVTAAGVGAYSSVATASTISVPGAVTNVSATPGLRALTIRWNTPAVPALAAAKVAGYRVEYSTSPSFTTYSSMNVKVVTAATTSAKISNLLMGTTYYARVVALNIAGTGEYSAVVSGKPVAVPAAITTVTATPVTITAGKVTVTWAAPTINGGSPVTGYSIEYSTTPDFTPETSKSVDINGATAAKYVLTGLAPSTLYYVHVAAKNLTGVGEYSDSRTATTIALPSAPTSFVVSPATRGLHLTWSAPASLSGRVITNYVVTYSRNADMSAAKTVVLAKTATSLDIANLVVGATYYVRVNTQAAQGLSLIHI